MVLLHFYICKSEFSSTEHGIPRSGVFDTCTVSISRPKSGAVYILALDFRKFLYYINDFETKSFKNGLKFVYFDHFQIYAEMLHVL